MCGRASIFSTDVQVLPGRIDVEFPNEATLTPPKCPNFTQYYFASSIDFDDRYST